MAGVEAPIGQAAALHRQAVAITAAVRVALDGPAPGSRAPTTERSVRELAERLRVAAGLLAPGWLGAPLDAVPPTTPLGVATRPEVVRIGTAYPLDDASFPVVVPLGHVAVDGDARDPRVAGMLRAVLLRLLATESAGSMRVRAVDATGGVFTPFAALPDAGIMPPPVTDRAGLCAVLTEAEDWVRTAEAGGSGSGDGGNGDGGRDRTLLLVVASWPQATEPVELARISALASAGPAAGLHLMLAGWPPPLLGEDSTEPVALIPGEQAGVNPGPAGPPLPHATRVTLRNPYALVGHPPGGSFGAAVPAGAAAPTGLPARVFLDEAPPADLIGRVCRDVAAATLDRARKRLGGVLPQGPIWTREAGPGLEVTVGYAGEASVGLRLADATPHWLVVGRRGSGQTALLLDILYGLCGQYAPHQLHCYLLDFSGRPSFAEFVPQAGDASYLPHARAVGVEPNRADAVAVLRGLVAELGRRLTSPEAAGPRVLCVIDQVDVLLDRAPEGAEPLAGEAGELLATLARDGGGRGIHLILAGSAVPPEPVARQCRVRIALPGGAEALDPANQAADELTPGTAVINTAGGLGGPPRVTRAHEQVVRFPHPYPDRAALAGLRHQLWRAGGGGP